MSEQKHFDYISSGNVVFDKGENIEIQAVKFLVPVLVEYTNEKDGKTQYVRGSIDYANKEVRLDAKFVIDEYGNNLKEKVMKFLRLKSIEQADHSVPEEDMTKIMEAEAEYRKLNKDHAGGD